MANESTVDQQQLQSTIDELYQKLSELFPAQRDALRNALNTIQVGESQTLGMLATADDLGSAPFGDLTALKEALAIEGGGNGSEGGSGFDPETLGALSILSSLSEAEVGDGSELREKLLSAGVIESQPEMPEMPTLGDLAALDNLSEAEVGNLDALKEKLDITEFDPTTLDLGNLAHLDSLDNAPIDDIDAFKARLDLADGAGEEEVRGFFGLSPDATLLNTVDVFSKGVGSLCFAAVPPLYGIRNYGDTIKGDDLTIVNWTGKVSIPTAFTGVWSCLGYTPSSSGTIDRISIWVRIA